MYFTAIHKSKLLIILCIIINNSCQNAKNNGSSNRVFRQSSIESDTSLWLKETRGIRDILEDKDGNLWFSSPDYIAKFDGKSMYYFSEKDGLNITGNIQEDDHGTIWIENGNRIFRYNGVLFNEEQIDNISDSDGLWIQRGLNPMDTSWVEPGLYEYRQNHTHFHPLPLKNNIHNKYLHLPTTKAQFGKDSTVWIGTMESVYGYKNNAFISIGREEMGRLNDERQMGIRGIFIDSRGVLWIADNGAGIFTFDGEQTVNFTKKHHLDKADVKANNLHRAFSIIEDAFGIMWFGTVYSGIWSYNPMTEEFSNYALEEGVISENIWMMYLTRKGELLFAGESPAAVYTFNGEVFIRKF